MGVIVRETPSGTYEGVDEETGEVVWTEKVKPRAGPTTKYKGKKPGRPRVNGPDGKIFHEVMGPDGKLHWLPKGFGTDTLPRIIWNYPECQTLVDQIMEMIANGATLREVGMQKGFPPHGTLLFWCSKYEDFKKRYNDAKAMRAEYHREQMLKHANDATWKTAPAERLRVETHKFMAEKDDPEIYGNKTKIVGDPDQPIRFVIATGISRDEPKPVDNEPIPQLQKPEKSE